MKKVQRGEIVDYQTYGDRRDEERARILEVKASRRIHVGEFLTFLFENADTVRYQIQEMMRAEQLVREADVQHEIDTYNELLGDDGELGGVVLIEIDDAARRDELLRKWIDTPHRFYVTVEGGERIHAEVDERQIGRGRVSSVQYVKFPVGGRTPIAVGCDHPELTVETTLDERQRAALEADLRDA